MSCCVSVILPRLPDGVPLQRTLNSIRRQTLKDIEILSAAPMDADIAADYGNLTLCEGFDDAVSRASGRYIYLMHPESVLAFTALQRLFDTIGENLWAVSGCVARRDGKDFAPRSDALSLVHASLFDGEFVKGIIKSGRIGGMELDLLPQFMRSVERVSYDGILVYIDEFSAVGAETTPELAALRVREYVGILHKGAAARKGGIGYTLFMNHVHKYYEYLWASRATVAMDELMPLFEALCEFMRIASEQPVLLRFIKLLMDSREVELFLLPPEAGAMLLPAWDRHVYAPDAVKKMEHERAVMDDLEAALPPEVVYVDAVSVFEQGREGMKTLIRCFQMWLKFKLKGARAHG